MRQSAADKLATRLDTVATVAFSLYNGRKRAALSPDPREPSQTEYIFARFRLTVTVGDNSNFFDIRAKWANLLQTVGYRLSNTCSIKAGFDLLINLPSSSYVRSIVQVITTIVESYFSCTGFFSVPFGHGTRPCRNFFCVSYVKSALVPCSQKRPVSQNFVGGVFKNCDDLVTINAVAIEFFCTFSVLTSKNSS